MDKQDIFRTWAPPGSPWSVWAKPVLFTQMRPLTQHELKTRLPENPLKLRWLDPPGGTAVILNLPGGDAIILGLFLASQGYRPVPLYNTSPGPSAAIDANKIMNRLRGGTPNLLRHQLPDDAPPVFLLDAKRSSGTRTPTPGDFDNRWVVFPQDFPSAGFLKDRAIHRVLLVQNGQRVDDDLCHVLRRWQQQNIGIELVELGKSDLPVPITVAKPLWFRHGWYRLIAMFNYRRNPAGGFGARVPQPSQSSGGYGRGFGGGFGGGFG